MTSGPAPHTTCSTPSAGTSTNLTDLCAAAAAPYTFYALEAASHAINGQPLTSPSTRPIMAADVFLLAQIHASLIQLPGNPAADKARRRRARQENHALAECHHLLTEPIADTARHDAVFDARG